MTNYSQLSPPHLSTPYCHLSNSRPSYHSKAASGLSDDEVADALAERSQRIYDKYGTMMLNTEGFSATGLERKATCKALFQKVLFLSECEALVKPGTEAASKVNLRTVRGDGLRLESCRETGEPNRLL